MRYGKCFFCNNVINPEDTKRMVPLEKPYVNLFFHLDCFRLVPDLVVYLTKNLERVYNYKENRKESEKKGKK